jgi:nucleoside-diphosphate-sugar epimerase
MKKVLVTGASGFVGRQCLAALIGRADEVHAVSFTQRISAPPELDVGWDRVDLLDQDQVTNLLRQVKATELLHCAWYAVPGRYWQADENYRWVDASLHLFRTFADVGGRRAVGVGSCAEYDWSYGRCSEFSTPLSPKTTYGACKLQVEAFLSQLGNQQSLRTAWGRLFFLYGPHERRERFVPSVINSLLNGEAAQCSQGEQIRDYLYAEDVGNALVSLLDSRVTGPVNIASGKAVTIKQIALAIAEKLGRTELLNFGEFNPEEPAEILADTTRLNTELAWSPQYDLDRGLDETISWWKLHK